MKRLAWVQFFSWFALFAMWIYSTPAVTAYHYGTDDVTSLLYNQGADWVAVLFAGYNVVAVVAAMTIPLFIRWLGLFRSHQFNLLLGAIGLASFLVIRDPAWVAGIDGGRRLCLGVHRVDSLRDSGQRHSGGAHGHLHGHLQFLHRDTAVAGGLRLLGIIVEHVFGGRVILVLPLAGLSMVAAAAAVRFVERQPSS